MKDLRGKDIQVGDTVAVARLNYKAAYLRCGTVAEVREHPNNATRQEALVRCVIRGRTHGAWTTEVLFVERPE